MKLVSPTDPLSEGELLDAVQPVIHEHVERHLSDVRRLIGELQMRITVLASIIADMSKAGEDTTEAERRFAIEMDRLEDLRLDEGSFQFLKYCSEGNRFF